MNDARAASNSTVPAATAARRAATGLAALSALVLASAGCQQVRTDAGKLAARPPAGGKQGGAEPSAPKTEFHREVGNEQQFNVHLEVARVHESQGNNEAAIAEYQKAVDASERRGAGQMNAAQQSLAQRRIAAAFDRMGRFAQAEVHYNRALKLAPEDPKVWNDAGYSYYLQNRLADSERALKTADRLEPNSPKTLTNLGLTLAAEGKTDDALQALSRAGGPAVGHANLGFILAAMGKTGEARRHYAEAVRLQPALVAASQAIAQLDATPSGRDAPTALTLALASPPSGTPVPPPSTLSTAIPMPSLDASVRRTASKGTSPTPPPLSPARP